ncbi:GGDEF domain-containing protein [bacterium]|jgi:two-component system cell cycle response regulator|nr:GGDEF domain-containing protein [bacterium]
MSDQDQRERTAILGLDQETINRELQRAKDQPACLILIRGNPQGHRFFLTADEMIIGRDPSADISIPDPSISRRHARVLRTPNGVTLEDLGSSNGTSINGKKIESGSVVELTKEDLIKLGNSIVKYLPAGEIEIIFYGNLNQAANSDPLTKCFNKGYFLEAIEAEVKRARAFLTPLSLIFFDLDHFKRVNDTHGHEGGDLVLKEFSNLVRGLSLLSQKDIFARYGGEEFCLLMPGTTLAMAERHADTIRAKVQAHAFVYEGKKIPVTTSLGVSELRSDMESASDLIKSADKALYQSKEGGRNRVTVSRG